MPAFVPGYLIGLVAAPLLGTILKPLLPDMARTTADAAAQVRKLAAEVTEDWQDLVAEVSAELAAERARSGISAAASQVRGAR